MHIVFVEQGYPGPNGGGGAGTYVQLIGQELARRGHRVSVIATHSSGPSTVSREDGLTIYRPFARAPLHWYLSKLLIANRFSLALRFLEQGRAIAGVLRRIDKKHKIDLIEFTEGGDYWHRWLKSTPYICHLHGSSYTVKRLSNRLVAAYEWYQRKLELQVIKHAAWIVAPSRAMLNALENETRKPLRHATVIPYPLNLALLNQFSPTADVVSEVEDNVHILFAARNDPVKGGDTLLQAAPIVCGHCPHAHFDLYGYQPTERELSLVRANNLADRITFFPFLPKEELFMRYTHADICVVPSYWDNSPNTVYEAMAAGKPVVASRVGGIPELVADNESGILVPPGDPQALACALEKLVGNSNLRRRMGEYGRARIKQIADLGRNAEMRLEIYERVLNTLPPNP